MKAIYVFLFMTLFLAAGLAAYKKLINWITVSWDIDLIFNHVCNNKQSINMMIDDCIVTEKGLSQISWGGWVCEDSWLTAEWVCSVLKCHCEACGLGEDLCPGAGTKSRVLFHTGRSMTFLHVWCSAVVQNAYRKLDNCVLAQYITSMRYG